MAVVPNAAAPVQSVVNFKTAFTEHLNEVIKQTPAQKGTTIFNTKIYKDFIDQTLVKTSNAQALSQADLNHLQELVNREQHLMTLTQLVTVYAIGGQAGGQFGSVMASSLLGVLPMVLVFIVFQRYYLQGIVSTGIKG